jgi:hypothetical protein
MQFELVRNPYLFGFSEHLGAYVKKLEASSDYQGAEPVFQADCKPRGTADF